MGLKQYITILLILPFICFSQLDEFDQYYTKSTVATFYSSTVLNSFHELNLASKLADSTLKSLDKNSEKFKRDSLNIHSLIEELNTSKIIAIDNLNYRIPSYSILTNNRSELNIIDEAEELLLEELLKKHFSQADPLLKGTLNDNTHYFTININPFDETLLGVVLDYFSLNSGHYAIRPHEINAILGKDGAERYRKDQLNKSDYKLILDNYKINKLYNVTFDDRGSILEGLFYYGSTLNTITKENKKKNFQKYFEFFRKDKSESFSFGIINFVLSLLLIFLFLRLYDVKSYKGAGLNSFFQKDYLKNDLIIIIISLSSLLLCYYIGSFISPAANSYHNEIKANLWVLYQVLGFPTLTFVLLLIGTLNLSNIPSLSLENLRKIFFSSITIPFLGLIILNQFASWELNSDVFEPLIMISLLIVPAHHLGKSTSPIFRNKITISNSIIIFIGVIALFYSQYSFLVQNYFNSNLSLILLNFLLPVLSYLFNKKEINEIEKLTNVKDEIDLEISIISKGFNYNGLNKLLKDLFENKVDQLLIINGTKGIGKKTLSREYLNNGSINTFHLDFSINLDQYLSFKNAFLLNNKTLKLSDDFFESPISFDKLYKGIGAVSSILPVNLPSVFVTEDENINIKETATELLNNISEKIDSEWCITIENLHQISEVDKNLLLELLNRLNSKSSLNLVKIIVFNDVNSDGDSIEILSDIFKGKTSGVNVICEDLDIVSKEIFENLNCSNQLKYYLNGKIKEVKDLSQFSVGKLFELIKEMYSDNVIGFDDKKLFLKNRPLEKHELSDYSYYLIEEFENLELNKKTLLEVSSIMGMVFDVNLVADVLKKDNLAVIHLLEDLENSNFIKDEKSNNNLFRFQSTVFYNWLRNEHLNLSESNKSQKIKEIQNRLISALKNNLKNVDVKTLISTFKELSRNKSNSFFKQEINSLNLDICQILIENEITEGLGNHLAEFLKANHFIKEIDQEKIISILDVYIKVFGNYSKLEKNEVAGNRILDEFIKDFSRIFNERNKLLLAQNILDDISRRRYSIDKNEFLFNRFQVLKEFLKENKIQSERTRFYISKTELTINLKKSNVKEEELIQQFIDSSTKIAIESNKKEDHQFASEIYRDLSLLFRNKGKADSMIKSVLFSLEFFDHKKIHTNDISNKSILKIVEDVINIRLSNAQLSNLSYSINRFLDAFDIKKDYETVDTLSNYNILINKKIKDRQGLIHCYRHKGKALFMIKKYQLSIDTYIEYFNYLSNDFNLSDRLIEVGELNPTNISERDNVYSHEDSITPVLEGILHNCKEIKNNTVYEKIKEFLYKDNIIISSKIKSNKLYWIDQNKTIGELIPKSKITGKNDKFSSLFTKAFLLINYSDDDITDQEFHDSIEYVNAIHLVTEKNLTFDKSLFRDEYEFVISLNNDQRKKEFKRVCQKIFNDYSIDTYLRFHSSLIKLAYTDYKISQEEIDYVDIAKSLIYDT